MAEFDSRMVTIGRIEFAVSNPTVAEEFGEAFTGIERAYKNLFPGRDPVGNIQVRATEDEIILFFDLDEQVGLVPAQASRVPLLADDFILRDTKNVAIMRTQVRGGAAS